MSRLRVEDGKLLNEENRQVVLEGLGLGAIVDVKAQDRWNSDYISNAVSWGAQMVRLPVNPRTYHENPEQTLADLDDVVTWCRRNGVYLIIDYHVIGNIPDQLFLYEETTTSTWEELEAFWATVAARYADEPTVAFLEIYNEPSELSFRGGSWSFDDWQQRANAIVAIVREHAPHAIPLVGGLDFAYDFSPGGDQPFADPNIALAAHPYPGKARTDRRESWDAAFGYLSDRYPIVFTELGFDPYDQIDPGYRGDLPYGREVISYAREKSISWAAFVFYQDPLWPMPLYSDWDTLEPTVSGAFFKDVLAGKDIDTAGDGFGERPPVEDPPANGPSNLHWNHWSDAGATAEWLEELGTDAASLRITAEGNALAGMFATFEWTGTPQDLSEANEAVFTGTIELDQAFSFTVGRSEGSDFYGCAWHLVGQGSDDTYIVNLLEPDWCGPEACFDLQASGIGFGNRGGSGDLDVRVTSVELRVNPDGPLPSEAGIGASGCE